MLILKAISIKPWKNQLMKAFKRLSMKKIILSILCALPFLSTGQVLLFNDQATIKVQAGATLFVEGGITNTSGGTIDSDGTIELQGSFLNQGNWDNAQPNTLKFSGNNDADVTAGTAQFDSVVITKGSGGDLTMLSNMTINRNLNFAGTNNRIVTGNFDLFLGTTATSIGHDDDEYVATTGTGMIQKAVTANGSFNFPTGDATFYSPLTCAFTGTSYTSANLRAKANNLTHPNKPADATDYLSRYWDINATGIGGYASTLTGTYNAGDDLTGSDPLVKGAVYDGTEWSYAGAAEGVNTVTGTTDDATADFTGTNFYGKAILKVFLAGAMPASTNPPMTTALSTPTQLIPLGSPYSVAPWNAPAVTAPSIPASTTDWILVETRDPSINIISQTSAFLKNDGTIVGIDGGPLTLKNAVPSAIVSIRHRNHLGIRTAIALDLLNPTLHDFSTDTTQAWRNPVISNSNMRLVGTTYCLWGGNANLTTSGLTKVSYLGLQNDPAAILSAMGGNNNNPLLETYHIADVNLNRKVSYLGLQNDPAVVLANMGGNNNNPRTQHLQ